jgi:sugar O-acyltransferase (sialic acid O-acetyltransferase NeuD family)
MKVLIIGAGGHGLVVCDILLRRKERTDGTVSVGFLDDSPHLAERSFLGCRVEGPISKIGEIKHDAVVIGIGDNENRKRIFLDMEGRGERLVSAIHPASQVAPDVKVGRGAMICAGVVVNPGSEIGRNVILNTGCSVDHHNRICDHVHIAPGVHLGGDVEVGEGALIGIGATVLPGVKIGPWAVVGGGAVVIKDVPGGMLAIGLPAVVREKTVQRKE